MTCLGKCDVNMAIFRAWVILGVSWAYTQKFGDVKLLGVGQRVKITPLLPMNEKLPFLHIPKHLIRLELSIMCTRLKYRVSLV